MFCFHVLCLFYECWQYLVQKIEWFSFKQQPSCPSIDHLSKTVSKCPVIKLKHCYLLYISKTDVSLQKSQNCRGFLCSYISLWICYIWIYSTNATFVYHFQVRGDLEITRKITATETTEMEHKGRTQERVVQGQVVSFLYKIQHYVLILDFSSIKAVSFS
jgi:hypothetical protein